VSTWADIRGPNVVLDDVAVLIGAAGYPAAFAAAGALPIVAAALVPLATERRPGPRNRRATATAAAEGE